MTKQEYLQALKDYLNDYPADDQVEILQSFENHIDESLNQGKTMDEIVEELGNIEDVFLDQPKPEQKNTGLSELIKSALEKATPFLNNMKFNVDFNKKPILEDSDSFPCSNETEVVIIGDHLDVCIKQGENASYSYEGYPLSLSKEQPTFSKEFHHNQVRFHSKHGHGILKITLPSNIHRLDIQTNSGDIHFSETTLDTLQIISKAGDVDINSITAVNTYMKVYAGDLDISQHIGNLELDSLAGDIHVSQSQGSLIKVDFKAGDIHISGDYPKGIIHGTAGDIDVDLSRIESFEIKNTTGDIQVNCDRHDFEIHVDHKIGDTHIPNYHGSGHLYISHTIGDIDID